MPERLCRGPCADPVVASPRGNPITGQSENIGVHRDRVTNTHEFLGLGL